jgi:hypothetical protein
MQRELKWSREYTRNAMSNYLEKIYHLMDSAGVSSKRDLLGQPAD